MARDASLRSPAPALAWDRTSPPTRRGRSRARGWIADLATLSKLPISALSTLSSAAGFLAVSGASRPPLVPTLAGTFLLASGAAALNEVIERDRDARMERTEHRPIPAGRIRAGTAAALAALGSLVGAALLWRACGPLPALLGAAALVWYDAVYTPLKRVTAFAVLPGAIVGALPPAIGWTAAGGALDALPLRALCFFFVLWQVAHFWLIALKHEADYARAGFPTPPTGLSPRQAGRIAFVWSLAAVGSALLLPLHGLARGTAAGGLLAAGALVCVPFALPLLARRRSPPAARRAFVAVNLLALAVMLAVAWG